jgi:actin-related protein
MRDSYGSYLIEDSSIADRQMNIILDFGVKFSKIGYAGEIEPRKIIKTPALFEYEKFFNQSVKFKMQQNEESLDIHENLNINVLFIFLFA